MAAIVDGYVIPVSAEKRATYTRRAKSIAAMFLEFGATEVVDAWGTDVPEGVLTSFPLAVRLAAGEAVVLGWVTWPSKAARDRGWKKAMTDPRMQGMPPGLIDGKRMIYGGFQIIQAARKGD